MSLPLPSAHERREAATFLRAARALIAPEGAWIPGWLFAEDATGEPVDPRDTAARRFSCGAALRCAGAGTSGFVVLVALPFLNCAAGEALDDYECRAGRSQADVVEVFDVAIALLDSAKESESAVVLDGGSGRGFANSQKQVFARVTA